MKLATFEAGSAPQLGAVVGDAVVPLNATAPGLPGDMIGLIAAWTQIEGEVRRLADAAAGALPSDRIHLLAPHPAARQDHGHRPELCRPHRRERPGHA